MKFNQKASNARPSKVTISRRVRMLQQNCDLCRETGDLSEDGFDCDVTPFEGIVSVGS